MAQLQECMTRADADPTTDLWPTTTVLFEELSVQFQVILECDYACQKIEHLKQGAMKINDFMVEFEALVTKAGITDLQAIDLLERNVNQEIIQALFYQGKRKQVMEEATTEVLQLGHAMEMYRFMKGSQKTSSSSGWTGRTGGGGQLPSPGSSNQTRVPTTTTQSVPMDVDATCTKPKVQCFKCKGYGHFA
ncbi:hypothetical protein DXG03_001075 [Asterophora parasitica]|uniref:Retrotransposon gag domain-containing protein n=1 Tax=Asterophora parasitica TaxID=117018 RepID=A0A9P7FWY7_9AGAR|nr:hypothetical protein DXG03_001075 [Asterophora parasitica]